MSHSSIGLFVTDVTVQGESKRISTGPELSPEGFYKDILTQNVSNIKNIQGVNSPLNIGRLVDLSQGLSVLPIHLAASYRKVRSLETLLDCGANPETRDQRGRNALHLVITHWPGSLTVLTACAKRYSKFQSTVMAMQQRAEDCLQVLCERGVDLDARVASNCQHTALHLAVRYAALSAVGILASHGASVNVADRFGLTPLHMAAGVLNTEIASCLIRLGADVNRPAGQSGNGALHLAVLAATKKIGRTLDTDLGCIGELLERGALPNRANKAGRTPLHEACYEGREAVVDLLLKHGADVNRLTSVGESCLYVFLDHKPNLKCTSLLGKLVQLTCPLTVTNKQGLLPTALTLPEYSKQKDRLVHLSQQPRDLLDICKIHLNQRYGENCRPALKELLPQQLFEFVFNYWDCPSDIKFFVPVEVQV